MTKRPAERRTKNVIRLCYEGKVGRQKEKCDSLGKSDAGAVCLSCVFSLEGVL